MGTPLVLRLAIMATLLLMLGLVTAGVICAVLTLLRWAL